MLRGSSGVVRLGSGAWACCKELEPFCRAPGGRVRAAIVGVLLGSSGMVRLDLETWVGGKWQEQLESARSGEPDITRQVCRLRTGKRRIGTACNLATLIRLADKQSELLPDFGLTSQSDYAGVLHGSSGVARLDWETWVDGNGREEIARRAELLSSRAFMGNVRQACESRAGRIRKGMR